MIFINRVEVFLYKQIDTLSHKKLSIHIII